MEGNTPVGPTRRSLLAAAGTVAAAVAGCADRVPVTDGAGTDADGETPRPETPPTASDTPATSPETPPDSPTPHPDEAIAWQRSVEAPVTTVAAAGATAFVGTERGLHAIDTDGSGRWAHETNNPVRRLRATEDLLLAVVGTNALASGHVLLAVDPATGATRWRRSPTDWWLELLGRRGDTVYVATADDAVAPDGQTLYALAAADGATQWRTEVGDPAGGLVTADAVYVPAYGRLYAVDHDGGRRWTRGVGYNAASMSAVGDTLAFSAETDAGGGVGLGLATADGVTRWTVDGWFVNSTRAGDGVVYLGGEHVAAIDPAAGDERWRNDAGGSLYGAPLVDGTLYAASQRIRAIDTADGGTRWTALPGLYLPDPAAVVGGTVYVHASTSRDDRNRNVVALRRRDGRERWRFAAPAPLADPVVAGDRLVAGSERGVVYGFV